MEVFWLGRRRCWCQGSMSIRTNRPRPIGRPLPPRDHRDDPGRLRLRHQSVARSRRHDPQGPVAVWSAAGVNRTRNDACPVVRPWPGSVTWTLRSLSYRADGSAQPGLPVPPIPPFEDPRSMARDDESFGVRTWSTGAPGRSTAPNPANHRELAVWPIG